MGRGARLLRRWVGSRTVHHLFLWQWRNDNTRRHAHECIAQLEELREAVARRRLAATRTQRADDAIRRVLRDHALRLRVVDGHAEEVIGRHDDGTEEADAKLGEQKR